MSYPEIVAKFGNVLTFTDYYGILESIPQLWKRIIRNEQDNQNIVASTFFEHFQNKLRGTSAIYDYLIDAPYLVNEQKVKWENCLEKPMDNKFFVAFSKILRE